MQRCQRAFVAKVVLFQVFLANQVKLCKFPTKRAGNGKRDLLEGFLAYETLMSIANEKDLSFEWCQLAQKKSATSASIGGGTSTQIAAPCQTTTEKGNMKRRRVGKKR